MALVGQRQARRWLVQLVVLVPQRERGQPLAAGQLGRAELAGMLEQRLAVQLAQRQLADQVGLVQEPLVVQVQVQRLERWVQGHLEVEACHPVQEVLLPEQALVLRERVL